MLKLKYITILLCVFLFKVEIKAQNYRFVHYNNKQGLLNNLVKECIQDSLGFIWLATDKGLSRFDGLKFLNISKNLPSNYIKSFLKRKSGQILATTDLGVLEIKSFADTAYTKMIVPGSLNETDTTVHYAKLMYEDKNEELWISDFMGIGRLGKKGFKRYHLDENAKSDNYQRSITICEDGFGHLYAFSINGFAYIFDKQIDAFKPLNAWKSHPSVYQAIEHKKGELLLSCSDGVLMMRVDSNGDILELKSICKDVDVYSLTVESENSYMVASQKNGLHRLSFNNNEFTIEKIKEFPFERINQLYLDNRKNVWASTDLGIYLCQPTFFNAPNTIISQKFILSTHFKEDGDGLICSFYLYTSKLVKNELILQTFKGLKADGSILYAEPSKFHKDCWWFTASSNIVSLMNKDGIQKTIELPTTRFPFYCYEDNLGNVWFCIRGYKGIIKLGYDFKIKEYHDPEGLIGEIICIKQNKKGDIYATGKGDSTYLFKYNKRKDTFENLSIPLNFEHKKTLTGSDLTISNNTIWIASTEGVLKYENGRIERLKIGESTDNNVSSIGLDFNGVLWFANNTGVFKMENNTPLMFNENSGLSNITSSYRCISFDKQNNIWIGTSAGINYADNSKKAGITPPPLITQILLNKEVISLDIKKLSLKQGSYITFKFVSLCYPGEDVSYQYQLIGQDLEWTLLDSKKDIVFPALPIGKYIFKVKARLLGNNQWSEATYFEFKVVPPWYYRWYSIFGFILTLILLIYGVIKMNTYRLAAEKKHLEKVVLMRTTQIQQKSNQLEKKNIEITQKNNEIEKKNKSITDSIMYASRIQQAVLPTELMLDIFPEHFILFKPRDIVSGDFYFAKTINNLFVLAAVDCTGHGVPGAFMSILSSALLTEIVTKKEITEAALVLNQLRDQIKLSLKQTGKIGEQQDGMDIAFCIIDLNNLQMQYSGANSPIYLIQKVEPNTMIDLDDKTTLNGYHLLDIKADHMPIGIHPKEKNFTNHIIQLHKDDVIYLFSDGYQSQFGGLKGETFKVRRLKNILLEIQPESMENQKIILEKTLADWQGSHTQVDDVLLMGIKF